jgi:hypothetical protein
MMEKHVPLGQTVITANANATLHPEDVIKALARHAVGDWGVVDDQDKGLNDRSLADGSRLLSAYLDRNNVKFWIITEADRSSTTILLPEDY